MTLLRPGMKAGSTYEVKVPAQGEPDDEELEVDPADPPRRDRVRAPDREEGGLGEGWPVKPDAG